MAGATGWCWRPSSNCDRRYFLNRQDVKGAKIEDLGALDVLAVLAAREPPLLLAGHFQAILGQDAARVFTGEEDVELLHRARRTTLARAQHIPILLQVDPR